MPLALASTGGKLYVTTDKGKGTGPNNFPQRRAVGENGKQRGGNSTYIPTLLYGSLAAIEESSIDEGLKASTEAVLESQPDEGC